MYYHSQESKYVIYGKIYPPPIEEIDSIFLKAYQWLSKYCNYFPQIWLSRSNFCITGYKNNTKAKKRYFCKRINFEPNIMFSFDIIKGFPVDYETWCNLLNTLINCKDPIKNGDYLIEKDLNDYLNSFIKEKNLSDNKDSYNLSNNDILYKWQNSKNYKDFLYKYLFVENDQVVVPSLNLKVAKEIFCRNEKQVKKLRNMGFIKDRIKILNTKYSF